MNQLFYNIAGGIVHKILKIRHEKRTTISEVIVRGKRNIKQNRNWLYFTFSVESSSFIFKNFKTEKGWNRPVCNLFGFTRVKRIVTALMPSFFLRCFSLFFASFKNSSPWENNNNNNNNNNSLFTFPFLHNITMFSIFRKREEKLDSY